VTALQGAAEKSWWEVALAAVQLAWVVPLSFLAVKVLRQVGA
jgi:hypothetical protein